MFVIVTGILVKLFVTKNDAVVVELESSLYDTCNTAFCSTLHDTSG